MATALKFCILNRAPPNKKQHPGSDGGIIYFMAAAAAAVAVEVQLKATASKQGNNMIRLAASKQATT